jgi:hypothetical protein
LDFVHTRFLFNQLYMRQMRLGVLTQVVPVSGGNAGYIISIPTTGVVALHSPASRSAIVG